MKARGENLGTGGENIDDTMNHVPVGDGIFGIPSHGVTSWVAPTQEINCGVKNFLACCWSVPLRIYLLVEIAFADLRDWAAFSSRAYSAEVLRRTVVRVALPHVVAS